MIAKIKWVNDVSASHPYTGLFKGADAGFIRFSTTNGSLTYIIPGIGIKLLRDGVDSGNFVAMKDIDGHSGQNFF